MEVLLVSDPEMATDAIQTDASLPGVSKSTGGAKAQMRDDMEEDDEDEGEEDDEDEDEEDDEDEDEEEGSKSEEDDGEGQSSEDGEEAEEVRPGCVKLCFFAIPPQARGLF